MLPALASTLGLGEILLIVLIILILFGSTKIPKFMRGIGAGVHEFKDGIKEGERKPEGKPSPEPEKK